MRDFSVEETNQALSQVTGMRNEGSHQKVVGGDNGIIEAASLRIDETNDAVARATGGYLQEALVESPKRKVKQEVREKRKTVFEKIRDMYIEEFAQAKTLSEFKESLHDMFDDIQEIRENHKRD